MWVNPLNWSATRVAIQMGQSSNYGLSFWFMSDGTLRCIGANGTNDSYFGSSVANADTYLPSGSWGHILFTHEQTGTGATQKIYINGTLRNTYTSTTNPYTINYLGNPLYIARRNNGTAYWSGNIDEVSIYDSVVDVSSIYNSGTPTTITGAVAYWKLGEEAKFTDNWLVPNSALDNYSKFNFNFDGVDDVVLCQTDTSGNLNQIDGAISVSCWVKTTETTSTNWCVTRDRSGGGNRDWNLLKDNFYGGGSRMYWLLWNTNSDLLEVRLTSANDPQGDPMIVMNDGNWHHIVAVYDGSDTAYLYTDGVLQGTTTLAGFGSFPLNKSSRVCIGGFNNGSLPTALVGSWEGGIDEVAIWNTALSGDDVLSIYNSGEPTTITSALSHWQMGENATYNSSTSEWTLPDQIGSNDATSTNSMALNTLVGEAPNYSGGGLSDGMTIEDRVGDAPNSDNNAVSYNMESTDIDNDTP